MNPDDEDNNFDIFRDCLSVVIISKLSLPAKKTPKKRTGRRKPSQSKIIVTTPSTNDNETDNPEDLSDFVDYLASEIFSTLPEEVRGLSYAAIRDDNALAERYATPIDPAIQAILMRALSPTVSDSLCSYGLLKDASDLDHFLEPVFNNYLTAATAAPPEYTPSVTTSRPSGCEICEREHLPLTYHHLIPRQVHAKAVKRGWHKEWELNKVAWLCRACHSFVHRIASNEELAKELYDVDLLLEREDVQRFAAWVGRVRWKAR